MGRGAQARQAFKEALRCSPRDCGAHEDLATYPRQDRRAWAGEGNKGGVPLRAENMVSDREFSMNQRDWRIGV
jgi:hypothetical protein